jgi:hypothetical protein
MLEIRFWSFISGMDACSRQPHLVRSMGKRRSTRPPSPEPIIPVSVQSAPVSRLHVWTIAPMLAALVAGLQFMAGAWEVWPQRPIRPAELDIFTSAGKINFHPDYDMRIYVLGTALTLALILAISFLWNRRLGTIDGEDRLAWVRFLLFTHIPAAGVLAILPLLWTNTPYLAFMSGCLGLLYCGAAFWASSRESLAAPWWLRWPKAVSRSVAAALVVGFIILLVYIPNTAQVSSWAYQKDLLHHWDFYMMAPALAYGHGMALGTDFFSQYGVGWPIVLSWASQISPLSYKLAIQIGVLWGCVYFSALFFFLRMLLKNTAWALAGVFLALLFQLYSGGDMPKWLWPSSTVLRSSTDIFLLAALLAYARSGRAWLGLPTGLFAALCLLFATDSGIFVLICLGFYFVAVERVQPDTSRPRQTWGFILATALTYAVVLLTGLVIASRGTLTRLEFWSGWTESLWLYSDGFGDLPIGESITVRYVYLLLVITLFFYLLAVGLMLEGLFKKTLTPKDFLVGLIALYGLAIFTRFIGRSHPWNLHHFSIPFCIVLTRYLAGFYGMASRAAARFRPPPYPLLPAALALVPSVFACLALVAMLISPGFLIYPNLLSWTFNGRFSEPEIPANSYLFTSLRDAPFPEQYQPWVDKFHATTEMMRALSKDGHKTVAMIAFADTPYLVETDLRPYFHYSPVTANMVIWKQVKVVQQQILDTPPDYLLFPREPQPDVNRSPTNDISESFLKTIKERFILDRQVYDFDVYRRKP